MLSGETQNLLVRILIALAEGEREVENYRKELASEASYDCEAIFRTLDNNGDNHITPKDVEKYLLDHGLEVNLVEVKFFLFFYDQDHDLTLTYGEIFKMIHPGKSLPKAPRYRRGDELDVKVDRKLYQLIEKEISMARIVLALFDDIKHKRDFNIHSAFHALKYYACITGDSINTFLRSCGKKLTAGDIRAIMRRLDINKDNIIDFCEFHAFLGYPECDYCCPCFPCPNCGVTYCKYCLQDIPCYLLGCNHKGMDSKMRCTSSEHSPGGSGNAGSIIDSLYGSRSINKSTIDSDSMSREWGDKGGYNKGLNSKGDMSGKNAHKNSQWLDGKYGQYPYGMNGYRGMSPEQYQLLQGLTNPEQLNKFMTMSNILDRQNSEEINLTNNLSLRLSPLRDFNPRDWGCKNCPCNIHSNPNVSCDCCTCNVCPFKDANNYNKVKQKTKLFPRVSLYSYSYSYEPDSQSTGSTLSMSYRSDYQKK